MLWSVLLVIGAALFREVLEDGRLDDSGRKTAQLQSGSSPHKKQRTSGVASDTRLGHDADEKCHEYVAHADNVNNIPDAIIAGRTYHYRYARDDIWSVVGDIREGPCPADGVEEKPAPAKCTTFIADYEDANNPGGYPIIKGEEYNQFYTHNDPIGHRFGYIYPGPCKSESAVDEKPVREWNAAQAAGLLRTHGLPGDLAQKIVDAAAMCHEYIATGNNPSNIPDAIVAGRKYHYSYTHNDISRRDGDIREGPCPADGVEKKRAPPKCTTFIADYDDASTPYPIIQGEEYHQFYTHDDPVGLNHRFGYIFPGPCQS